MITTGSARGFIFGNSARNEPSIAVPLVESFQKQRLQTVRGSFQEGAPAFPGSEIRAKSPIQIGVRDVSGILGYFRPQI